MQALLTRRFERSYAAAPAAVRKAADKQLRLLLQNLQHPSLHAKRFLERGSDVWQARVNRYWRFYFTIEGDTLVLIDVIKHPN